MTHRIALLTLLIAAALVLMAQTPVQTPAGEESIFDKPLQVFRGPAGEYEIIVTVQPQRPRVGTVHFGVTVLHPASQTILENAKVLIVAYNPEGEPTYQTPALNHPAEPIHYKGNIIFRSAGQWSLRVKVDTPEYGSAEATTPLHIFEPATTPGVEGVIVLALVTTALLGGTAYVVFMIRRAQRNRQMSGMD